MVMQKKKHYKCCIQNVIYITVYFFIKNISNIKADNKYL